MHELHIIQAIFSKLIMVQQTEIVLPSFTRGFHLITSSILDKLPALPYTGILQLFIQHTSAALSINENADIDVRRDMGNWFDKSVKENEPFYLHTMEGADDMPAHIKSTLVGCSISIPITGAKLNLGTWQGIYLCEFRNHGGQRTIIATILS